MSQELILYTNDAPALDADRFRGWELVARGKQKMDGILQGHALALQNMLLGAEAADQKTLADLIAAYKKEHSLMVASRQSFTSVLDGIKEQCMTLEKQLAPGVYLPFIAATNRELALRKEANEKAQRDLNKEQEKASLRAWALNQYASIGMDYRSKLERIALSAYTSCLTAKAQGENVEKAKQFALEAMYKEKPIGMGGFNRIYLKPAEAQAIFSGIEPVNLGNIYNECVQFLHDKFSMYESDLHNAEAMVQQAETAQKAREQEQAQQTAQATAVNTMVQAAAVYVDPGPAVKKLRKIVMEDENERWVMLVAAAFIQNFQKAMPKIRSKNYSKITIGQMANALTDADVTIEGAKYENIEK